LLLLLRWRVFSQFLSLTWKNGSFFQEGHLKVYCDQIFDFLSVRIFFEISYVKIVHFFAIKSTTFNSEKPVCHQLMIDRVNSDCICFLNCLILTQ
jgi:hypothetical protein